MEALGLILGHLLGDYIAQGDYEAKNKALPGRTGALACLLHCTLYGLCVLLCSFWWGPWWFAPVVALLHFPVDRWRLARKFMSLRQEAFATGPLAPWSIVVVDNTIHLAALFVLSAVALGA